MFWADEIAAAATGQQVVNDSKTPSGTATAGSLRGPVIHDVVWRALRAAGRPVRFLYGVDDLDPMDSQSLLTADAIARQMGVPLANVPAPAGSQEKSFARHFVGRLFLPVFQRLGIDPEFYWMSEVYRSGAMDPYLRLALDRADVIRDLYRRISNVERPAGWLPVSVICERCGRIGTTSAADWDGKMVSYACLPDHVRWAQGCGNRGRVSPFGGGAKLLFNVDWAARWSLFGVTIEGCGKDLATAGGSRDRSDAVAREVFERPPPLNVTYEFLNIGGRKMSTSRGIGSAAHEIAEVVPGEQLRLLFVRPRPNQVIEFDPVETDAIPRLFDESDRLAAATAGREVRGELPQNPQRLFASSQVDPEADIELEASAYRPPFAHLALLVQVPGVVVSERVAAEKGSPLTNREREILTERMAAAVAWLEGYAPDRARISVHYDRLPPATDSLTDAQRAYLGALAEQVATSPTWSGEALQGLIFTVARERTLTPGDAFAAIYVAFLGVASGPRAGWLLASLERAFVEIRLRDAAAPGQAATRPPG